MILGAESWGALSAVLVAVALVWGCPRPGRWLDEAAFGTVCPCAWPSQNSDNTDPRPLGLPVEA